MLLAEPRMLRRLLLPMTLNKVRLVLLLLLPLLLP